MVEPDFPMPHGYLWQYEIIRWLQSLQWLKNPVIHKLLHACTVLGVDTIYVVVLPIIFWAFNKKLGLRLAYVFLSSMFINGWIKDALGVVRPIGVPGIRSSYVWTGTGFAMPSGHAQGTMTFWLLVGRWLKRWWLWPLIGLFLFGVGLSRVYFGLHWPLDVVIGWGAGALIAILGWWIGAWWTYREYPFRLRLGLAAAIPVALLILNTGATSAAYGALLLGIGVGAVLEEEWFHLEIPAEWWKRGCVVVIGMAGLIALQWLIKWPTSGLVWILLKNVLFGLWATLGAPWLFMQCGLYTSGEKASH